MALSFSLDKKKKTPQRKMGVRGDRNKGQGGNREDTETIWMMDRRGRRLADWEREGRRTREEELFAFERWVEYII